METVLDLSFGAADDAGSVALIVIALDVLHGRTGKHALRSPDGAASRADIDRADRTRRSDSESHNPHRFAAIISAQGVIGCCKGCVRGLRRMARHRECAARIEV